MSLPYIDADRIAEASQALRDGIPIDRVAGHLGVTTDALQQLLGLPQWRADAAADGPCDLWAADDLGEVL